MQYIPLKGMQLFREMFEQKIDKYTPNKIAINEHETAYVINDSLILLVLFEKNDMPVCLNAQDYFPERINNLYLSFPEPHEQYYNFVIEEITHNDIGFKFKTQEFVKELEDTFQLKDLNFDIFYRKFKGFQRTYWCPEIETSAERINRLNPDLHIRDRYDNWTGNLYNYIVFEFEGLDNKKEFAVSYTQSLAQVYVNKICNEYIKSGKFGTENTRFANRRNFECLIKSWKRMPRQEIVEKHLKFYVTKEFKKEFDDVWKYADKLLIDAQNDKFNALEASSYLKPTNKWVTEELVYNLTKKIFKNHNVIYQHRPYFLKSSIGGQMSYDIFVSGLNVAIEYQGKQHFEPIDFFGGEVGFERVKIRDAEKLRLSNDNGVKLVYINYWEEVSEELIRQKLKPLISDSSM